MSLIDVNLVTNLLAVKPLNDSLAVMLAADGWTVEKLAVAAVAKLVMYKGIGKVTARKIIAEAAEVLNAQGLDESEGLAEGHYYQKSSLSKILADWEAEGLAPKAVALSSARALAVLKGIDEPLALRLISEAQDIVNQHRLYESGSAGAPYYYGPIRQINSAFDESWLSGAVEPPPMSVRVRRNFEQAQKEYEAANG